jgi:predicted nucleotidyltransferase
MTTSVSPALPREWPVTRLIERLREHRAELASRYQIAELGVFGSYVRNEQRPDSDLDVLVSFVRPPGLLTIVALEQELNELLGTRVDLAVKSALRPRIAAHVLNEVVFV